MIELLVTLVLTVGGTAAIGGALGVSRRKRLARVAARRALAEACGFEQFAVARSGDATGTHGGLRVRLETYQYNHRQGTRVLVGGLARDLDIKHAGFAASVAGALGSGDLEVGDSVFDGELVLWGSATGVRALLDAATRAHVRKAFAALTSPRVVHGTLSADFDEKHGRGIDAAGLGDLLALAHRLEPPADAEARLAEIARTDPLSGVRANALRTLVEVVSWRPETRAALLAGTRDPEPAIRLQAAQALGDGAEAEAALLALTADPLVEDATAAGAIAALGGRFPLERARTVLDWAANAGRVRTALAALPVVAKGGAAEGPGLASVLERSKASIAIAAAEALGLIGGASVEPPLTAALRSAEEVVAAAAAHALAACGGVGAVADLREAEERGGAVRRAARTAITSIQSRLTGATPGQVSLAAGGEGELSVVDSTDGRVSLKTDGGPR